MGRRNVRYVIVCLMLVSAGAGGAVARAGSAAAAAPEVTLQQTVDKASAKFGDTLTYTVTATNSGDVPLTKAQNRQASAAIDLSTVLLDASFEGVQQVDGSYTFHSRINVLVWSVDLPVGQSAQLRYTMKVTSSRQVELKNQVINQTVAVSNCALSDIPTTPDKCVAVTRLNPAAASSSSRSPSSSATGSAQHLPTTGATKGAPSTKHAPSGDIVYVRSSPPAQPDPNHSTALASTGADLGAIEILGILGLGLGTLIAVGPRRSRRRY
jgi:uncharacterized repeat protein (TIGR01451 family)